MRFQLALFSVVACLATAAPIYPRQGAGVGAGCDSIFSDTDTMIGESSRGSGKTAANAIPRSMWERQGAGVGAACNSIFSDTDTMIGESSRGSGKTIANAIPRQLNGIADGFTAVTGKAPAAGPSSDSLDSQLNTLDGEGTDGSAQVGQEIGDAELQVGSTVGGSNGQSGGGTGPAPPPGPHRRQLNGIADGATAPLAKSQQTSQLGSETDAFLNTVDGQGTDDSAEAGQIVGDEELNIGSTVGGSNGQSGGGTTAPAKKEPAKPAGPAKGPK